MKILCLFTGSFFFATVLTAIPSFAQNLTPGQFAINWCMTKAKSRLGEMNQSKHNWSCGRAARRHGPFKHQNELGRSAVIEICRGNFELARDFVIACQCHNPAEHAVVWNDWGNVVTWAQNHLLCAADRNHHAEGRACEAQGMVWIQGRCLPRSPPQQSGQFFIAVEHECRDMGTPSGNVGTGRFYTQFGGPSCEAAKSQAGSWASGADQCRLRQSNWFQVRWTFTNNGICSQ